MHGPLPSPSRGVTRWAPLIPASGRVLDLACGSGRHLRWLAGQGWAVTGVDRDAEAVQPLRDIAEIIVADLEGGPWPLQGRRFDGIVVTNYLWRALLPRIAQALGPGGVLIYETFAEGQERFGRPNNPEFLLQRGELLRAFADLSVVAYEDGLETGPERRVQRVVAVAGLAPGGPGPDPKIAGFEPRRLLPPRTSA
jgi:SAM-dependent methyltransferase